MRARAREFMEFADRIHDRYGADNRQVVVWTPNPDLGDRRMPANRRHVALPGSVQAFNKTRKVFEAWLLERGSAIKQATNPYEVIRFVGVSTECVVYRKANDTISNWSNGAAEAYRAFLDGAPWRATARGKRDPKRTNLILSLVQRDGWSCVFCGVPTDIETVTIEHFVPVTSGGNSHMANLSLAHRDCNAEASHLSVREKIEMIVRRRCQPMVETGSAPAEAALLN